MNRKSLGADIYSPIRFTTSFTDSSLNADGSISEICSGSNNAGSKVDDEKLVKLVSDEDSYEFRKEKPVKTSKTADKKNKSSNSELFSLRNGPSPNPNCKNSTSSSKLDDSVFTTSPTENENGRITVRKSSRKKEKQDSEKQSKEKSASKKNPKTLFPPKFVTVRRDSRQSSDHKRSSCKSNVDVLPTHSEASEDFKEEVPVASSNVVLSDKSKGSSNSSDDSSRLLGASCSSGVDCSTQTVLTLAELQTIIKKSLEFSEKKEVPLSTLAIKNECINNTLKKSSDMEASVSQPAQIHANIMEKVVRDIVDPECCEIRQILYLHHLANSKLLFKILDELEVGRSKELLKENQQLRNENQQLRIENRQIRNENIQLRKTHIAR